MPAFSPCQLRLGPFLVLRGAMGMSLVIILLCLALSGSIGNRDSKAIAGSEEQPCRVNDRYPQEILQWCGLITVYAENNNLSPDLIAGLIWYESGGNPLAYSRSGAVGLMQVMPRDGLAANFMCANGPCFARRPTIAELQDPEFNLEYGTRMLAGLYARTLSLREALKAYGPARVGYTYADTVLSIYERYQR